MSQRDDDGERRHPAGREERDDTRVSDDERRRAHERAREEPFEGAEFVIGDETEARLHEHLAVPREDLSLPELVRLLPEAHRLDIELPELSRPVVLSVAHPREEGLAHLRALAGSTAVHWDPDGSRGFAYIERPYGGVHLWLLASSSYHVLDFGLLCQASTTTGPHVLRVGIQLLSAGQSSWGGQVLGNVEIPCGGSIERVPVLVAPSASTTSVTVLHKEGPWMFNDVRIHEIGS